MKNIKPIRTEDDYDWALAEIERYFDKTPEPGSAEGDRFDVLAELIESYEAKHWAIYAPDPVELIREVMMVRGLEIKHLAGVLGSAPRASEILSRKRPLNLGMIQKIHAAWGIPADMLIQPYHLEGSMGA